MIKFLNGLLPRRIKNNRGIFGLGASADYSTSTTNAKSRQENAPTEFSVAPEYAESEGARKSWWEQLQSFAGQPGYGAISPDWASIWENAQKKVQQYFWGSPTDPGLVGKVKSSAAARGVAESPAREKMIQRMGATESGVLSDMAVQQAQSEAEFAESGRLNYLQQLQTLAGYTPQVAAYTPWQTKEDTSKTSGWGVGLQYGVSNK